MRPTHRMFAALAALLFSTACGPASTQPPSHAQPSYEVELTVDGAEATTIETGEVASLDLALRKAKAPLAGGTIKLRVEGGGSIDSTAITVADDGEGTAVYTAPDEAATVRVIATFIAGGVEVTDSVTIEVIEPPNVAVQLTEIYQAYGVDAHAMQSGVPSEKDSHDDWIDTTGSLVGLYEANASAGSAQSTASVSHDSEVVDTDPSRLLVVQAAGSWDGSVAAEATEQAGASLGAGSSVRVTFTVLGGPAYFEITANGVATGAGSGNVMLATLSDDVIFEKDWGATPIVEKGSLPAGEYTFDAGASVLMGAGTNSSTLESSARGAASYELVFQLFAREPKQAPSP